MFTCGQCGKKFKTMQALGGHMRSHAQNKAEAIPAGNNPLPAIIDITEQAEQPQTPPDQTTVPEDEPGIMDSIRGLKRRGLSARQIKDLGYKRQTVDDVFLEEIVPERTPEGKREEKQGENNGYMPAVVKKGEILSPEFIVQHLANGDGGDDWAKRIEGMMLIRAAQKMNREDAEIEVIRAEAEAKRLEPLLKVLREGREELDSAAARAKDSSAQIAHEAAFEVAQGMGGAFSAEIRDLKAALPGKPEAANPLTKMFVDAMQPYAAQAIGQLFAGLSKPPSQAGAQPRGGQQPGQPEQPASSGEPPRHMPPGEEDQWTEI